MKKLFVLLFLYTCLASSAQAQFEIGGGLIYGTDIEELGISGRAAFRLTDNWRIQPTFNYFFTEDVGSIKTSVWSLNADANYVFGVFGVLKPYVLAGLNITTVRVKIDDNSFLADNTESDTEVGVNLGGGLDFDLKKVIPFVEIKFVLSDFDQAVLAGGVKFGF